MIRDTKREPIANQEDNRPAAEPRAVALHYDAEKNVAPKVVAKGRGHVAERILELAHSSGVPVYQNKTLVNMLIALEIDREIPPDLYRAVAEIMAHVYRIDKQSKKLK